jgi:predicted phosphohydrolase
MRPGDSLVVGLHYLPFFAYNQASPFSDLIEAAGASLCVYGHLHTPAEWQLAFQGLRDGTVYRLLAADYLQMTPLLLGHLGADGLTLALALS